MVRRDEYRASRTGIARATDPQRNRRTSQAQTTTMDLGDGVELNDASKLSVATGDGVSKDSQGRLKVKADAPIRITGDGTFVLDTHSSLRVTSGKLRVSQGPDRIADLTDLTAGTSGGDTVGTLTDPAGTTSASALRSDLVANLIPDIRNNEATIIAKLNFLLGILRKEPLEILRRN